MRFQEIGQKVFSLKFILIVVTLSPYLFLINSTISFMVWSSTIGFSSSISLPQLQVIVSFKVVNSTTQATSQLLDREGCTTCFLEYWQTIEKSISSILLPRHSKKGSILSHTIIFSAILLSYPSLSSFTDCIYYINFDLEVDDNQRKKKQIGGKGKVKSEQNIFLAGGRRKGNRV